MVKVLRFRFVLLVGVLVFFASSCGIAAEAGSRWLVSPELLRHAGFEMVWANELPMKKTESLERLFILGNRIYALSDRNFMVSLNREDGKIVFSESVSPAGFPVVGLELYEDKLISMVGSRVVEIDPESGTVRSAKGLGIGVVCPAVRNSSYVYLAGTDRRLHTLRAEDKVPVFEVAADNDSMITSVAADEQFVVFATDAGNVISIAADGPRKLWQFDAADSIAGPIVRDEESIFFASKDTNVYRVDVVSGEAVWKYQTAAVLDKAPVVMEEVVYQYVRYKGLEAIERTSGTFMWQVREGVDLLAEAEGKAYVITKNGELVVMDNTKRRRVYSVNFAGVSRYVSNVMDSKIYIAESGGRIACLRPVE